MLRNLLVFDFTVSDLTLSDLAVPDFTLSEFTSSCAELPFFCPGGQARTDPDSNATATAGIQRCENRGDIGSPSAARGWSVLCKVPPTRIHSRRFERHSPSAGAIATRHKGLNAKRVRVSTGENTNRGLWREAARGFVNSESRRKTAAAWGTKSFRCAADRALVSRAASCERNWSAAAVVQSREQRAQAGSLKPFKHRVLAREHMNVCGLPRVDGEPQILQQADVPLDRLHRATMQADSPQLGCPTRVGSRRIDRLLDGAVEAIGHLHGQRPARLQPAGQTTQERGRDRRASAEPRCSRGNRRVERATRAQDRPARTPTGRESPAAAPWPASRPNCRLRRLARRASARPIAASVFPARSRGRRRTASFSDRARPAPSSRQTAAHVRPRICCIARRPRSWNGQDTEFTAPTEERRCFAARSLAAHR